MSLPLAALLEGKYEILDKIGEGGIGSIYKVRHQLLDEIRVIKVLRAQVAGRDDLQQRLMKEAQTAIRLTHPNIARLHDLAMAEDGTAYIVMEFIDGVSLDSLLAATGPPSLALGLEIAKQGLKAIAYLHDEGFIHRDISPDNLMLTRDFQGGVRVKLIDLGIAKDVTQTSGVTAAGTFLGKVKYTPPELFRDPDGVTQLDQRSDNYSFGITLYELLTGHYPFKGETFEELAAGHLFRPPLSFDETDPEGRVPAELREIIMAALAKDPEGRPANADEFVASLEQFEVESEGLESELERKVDETARFLSKFEKYDAVGSTQDHLNAQFGVERTSGVSPASVPQVVAPAAGGTEGDDPAAEEGTVETVTVQHAAREAPTSSRRRGKSAWVLAAGGLAAVATVLAWFALRPAATSTGQEEAVLGEMVPVVPTERWSSDETTDVVNVPLVTEEGQGAEGGAGVEPTADEPAPSRQSAATEPTVGSDPPRRAEPTPAEPASAKAPPAPASVQLLKAGPGVVPPRLLSALEPSYPKPDKDVIVVTISALVGADGRVLAATVKKAPAFKRRYREAALAAANAADFEAATQNGVPGKMWVDVDVRFLP